MVSGEWLVASGEWIRRQDVSEESHMDSSKKPKSYEDLLVWQKGIRLVVLVYRITRAFPSDERFGLMAQMRRAAVSVPSNIAEGQARHTTGEFIQAISHAEGSLAELETQLLIAIELGFCPDADARPALDSIDELQRMLHSLRTRLTNRR